MNGVEFFHKNLARLLVAQTGDIEADVDRAANGALPRTRKIDPRSGELKPATAIRFTKGEFALVRETGSTVYAALTGLPVEIRTGVSWNQVIVETLRDWAGEPIMFVSFGKVTFPVQNLFVTYDLRRVRLCDAKGVSDVNFVSVLDLSRAPEMLNGSERTLRNTLLRMTKEEAKRGE